MLVKLTKATSSLFLILSCSTNLWGGKSQHPSSMASIIDQDSLIRRCCFKDTHRGNRKVVRPGSLLWPVFMTSSPHAPETCLVIEKAPKTLGKTQVQKHAKVHSWLLHLFLPDMVILAWSCISQNMANLEGKIRTAPSCCSWFCIGRSILGVE